MSDHLRRAAVWLFGRRPVRPQRPLRRAGLLAVGLASTISLLAGAQPFATVITIAGILLLLASMLF